MLMLKLYLMVCRGGQQLIGPRENCFCLMPPAESSKRYVQHYNAD